MNDGLLEVPGKPNIVGDIWGVLNFLGGFGLCVPQSSKPFEVQN